MFGGVKIPTVTPQSSTFQFGGTTDISGVTNPFAKTSDRPNTKPPLTSNIFSSIKPMTTTTDSKPASSGNIFGSIKSTSQPPSLFPPNSPFNKFPPVSSTFTPEMATQKPPPSNLPPPRTGGPIRTPRHSIRDQPLPQTPQPQPSTFRPPPQQQHHVQKPLDTPAMETPVQRTAALVRSNGDNVPIATPDRNPAEPPEKHYWQRIKAMNQAFSEAVVRSIDGDAYCNLEWLFGQYKYWR